MRTGAPLSSTSTRDPSLRVRSGQEPDLPLGDAPGHLERFVAELLPVRHQVVDFPPDGLLGGVAEQPLRRGVPGGHVPLGVDGYDGGGAYLVQRLVILRLPVHLGDVVIHAEDAGGLFVDQEGRREQLYVHQRAVLAGSPGEGVDVAGLWRCAR